MKEYYKNIEREEWLRGTVKSGLRDKLYVFVHYGHFDEHAV
jgi:hypothetical protein